MAIFIAIAKSPNCQYFCLYGINLWSFQASNGKLCTFKRAPYLPGENILLSLASFMLGIPVRLFSYKEIARLVRFVQENGKVYAGFLVTCKSLVRMLHHARILLGICPFSCSACMTLARLSKTFSPGLYSQYSSWKMHQ